MKFFTFLFSLLLSLWVCSNLSAQVLDQPGFEYYNIVFAHQTESPDSVLYYNADGEIEAKILLQHNPAGKILSYVLYDWYDNKWEPDLKEEITYDSQNEPQSVVFSVYSDSQNQWEIRSQATIENLYDQGKKYAIEYSMLGTDIKTRQMIYCENDKVSKVVYLTPPIHGDVWTEKNLDLYEYDINGYPSTIYNYYFYEDGTKYGTYTTFKVDNTGKIVSEETFKMLSRDPEVWNTERSKYATYYYPGSQTGISGIRQSFDANVWMEGRTLHVESETDIASVSVYNMTGTLLYQNTENSCVHSLYGRINRGIYIVCLKNFNGKISTTKLLIR